MKLFNKKRIFILLAIFTVCFSVHAQSDMIKSELWYITKCRDKKILEKDIQGPFYSREQAIAVWIYHKTPENKNICIAKNYTFVTKKPSSYYRRLYAEIRGEIERDENTAIFKYNLNNDPERDEQLLLEFEERHAKSEAAKNSTGDSGAIVTNENPEAESNADNTNSEATEQTQNEKSEMQIETEVTPSQNNSEEINDSKSIETNPDSSKIEAELPNEAGKKETLKQEETEKKSDVIPFTLNLDNKATVRRYRKEYLQDYIPVETYNPEEKVTVTQPRIENPDALDAEGRSMLMIAAKNGNDWQIKNLIDSNANINLQDKDGWTALMYAVRYQESATVVKDLLAANADVKITNNFDYSALVLAACYNNNPEILNLLLDYYSISEKEVLKAFTLMISSKQISEYSEIAKLNVFLKRSIPLNSFYNGKTPLMYAAQFGNSTKIIKLLLENEALTGLRSTDGKTAFDYAMNNKNLTHDETYWALNKK